MQRPKRSTIVVSLAVALIAVPLFFAASRPLGAEETNTNTPASTNTNQATVDVSDLQSQKSELQQKIDQLNQQQQVYQANVQAKQQEVLSLQNQISILDNQISDTDAGIQKRELQIELLNNDIDGLESNIKEKNTEVDQQKLRLAELLRFLSRYSSKTTLEVTLLNDTFSEYYNQMKYLQTIEAEAQKGLDAIEGLKKDLEQEKSDQEAKRQQSQQEREQLAIDKKDLTSQQDYRQNLLTGTKNSEAQFQALLDKAKQEQVQASADIQTLDAQIRQRLSANNELPAGPTEIMWPVASRTVTATFHDPSYPFRKYFEHPGIDIATPQGTALRAAATGYVGRAFNGGMGYSYIMLVHGNGLSTVYGHVSQISVVENDYVVQGQVIGYSGATPGTPGAGPFTTGPHLHFEVRLNGIPVNPLDYLP